ncbi:hypothetical protein KKC13_08315 [bacterium]|nr:hypothetical protein [bacterium]MBU1959466.1 hypothetical protein [bacterium]
MKHLLLSLSLLFFTACVTDKAPEKLPQENNILGNLTSEQLEVKKALDLYLSQLKSLNADNIIKMTYPKLFIPINQTMFKTYLNSMLSSSNLGIRSFDANITKIDKINPFSNGKFTKVNYKSTITIHFRNPELYNTDYKILVLNKMLSKKYGGKNINVDTKKRTITIIKKEKMLAIREHNNSWTFLGDNPEYRRLYPKILPTDILDNI